MFKTNIFLYKKYVVRGKEKIMLGYVIKEEYMNPTARRLLHSILKKRYSYSNYTPTMKHRVSSRTNVDTNHLKRCQPEMVPCLAEPCLFEMYLRTFFDKSWKLPVESSSTCIICRLLREGKISFLDIRVRTDDSLTLTNK
jgi:hypothetical protein